MRKRILSPNGPATLPEAGEEWLDVDAIAQVEVTSEDAAHPIELAFNSDDDSGWRAAGKGEQIIRLRFDRPQHLKRIWLRFSEPTTERTQQFTLKWSADGQGAKEIVRQQWNFNPGGSSIEIEDYKVDLKNVASLELTIKPDISGGDAVATLADWRLA